LDCLDAHVHFKPAIQQLTAVASNKLQAYKLTEEQWDLAEELAEVLVVSIQISAVQTYHLLSDLVRHL
jgi:hypothetical protein